MFSGTKSLQKHQNTYAGSEILSNTQVSVN